MEVKQIIQKINKINKIIQNDSTPENDVIELYNHKQQLLKELDKFTGLDSYDCEGCEVRDECEDGKIKYCIK